MLADIVADRIDVAGLIEATRHAGFEARLPSIPGPCPACEDGDHGSIGGELTTQVFRCSCPCHKGGKL